MTTLTITQAGPSTSILMETFSMRNDLESKTSTPEATDLDIIPPHAIDALQRWNEPKINMHRVFATFWSFFVFGMNDGCYGALVPYLERYYDLSYTVVSLIFLSPFAGYTLASLCNNEAHVRFGQRGIAIIGPSCHLVSYWILAFHPPYPVLVLVFVVVGFGNGLLDAAWCAWIGNMAHANQVSGFLQACYSLGATVSPLIATALVEKGHASWYTFYYIMIATSFLELLTSTWAFWAQTGAIYQAQNPQNPNATTGRTREALKNKLTWVFALFVFGYVGAEVSLGGWIITFMTSVRHSTMVTAATTSTGFWAGMTVGRLTLSFCTAFLGEFYSVLVYLGLTVVLELIFWLVPNLVVSAVAVAFLGFFMGPMFPTAVVLITKLLPRSLHVACIGFAIALGGSGGAIFPFAVGAIAQARGVRMLQPVILALLAAMSLLWVFLPREKKQDESIEIAA